MDREEEYDSKHRQASLAGILAGLFILLMVGAIAVTFIKYWPG